MFRKPRQPEQLILPTRQDPDTYPSELGLVQAALITIRNGLGGYAVKFPKRSEQALADYDMCQRGRDFTSMGIVALSDGFVLQKVTRGGLADFSHRLKIPDQGGDSAVNYHRDGYNVDLQALDPRPIDITGDNAIVRNPAAVVAVLSFERDIIYSALTNWENFETVSTYATRC